jgi:hypothetical protein
VRGYALTGDLAFARLKSPPPAARAPVVGLQEKMCLMVTHLSHGKYVAMAWWRRLAKGSRVGAARSDKRIHHMAYVFANSGRGSVST